MTHTDPSEFNVEFNQTSATDEAIERDYRFFGGLLQGTRRRAGLTLQALSSQTQIAVATLNRWELGQIGNPNPSALLSVATAIKLSPPDQIFGWIEENDRRLREKAIERSLSRSSALADDAASNESSVLQSVVDILEQKNGVARFAYFGAKLMRARRRAGFTLQGLAKQTHISQQALSKWENGLVENPNPTHLLNVAKTIGLDPVDQIFDWIDENKQLLREVALEQSVNGIPTAAAEVLSAASHKVRKPRSSPKPESTSVRMEPNC